MLGCKGPGSVKKASFQDRETLITYSRQFDSAQHLQLVRRHRSIYHTLRCQQYFYVVISGVFPVSKKTTLTVNKHPRIETRWTEKNNNLFIRNFNFQEKEDKKKLRMKLRRRLIRNSLLISQTWITTSARFITLRILSCLLWVSI
jgi:hypothetical protein